MMWRWDRDHAVWNGLAFYLGKAFIRPSAPQLPSINFGFWSHSEQVRAALKINWLFFVGWRLRRRWPGD